MSKLSDIGRASNVQKGVLPRRRTYYGETPTPTPPPPPQATPTSTTPPTLPPPPALRTTQLPKLPALPPLPPPPGSALNERVPALFQKLAKAAAELNAVSDELAKPIAAYENALKTLNLGISAWVEMASSSSEDEPHWWDRGVGYTRFNDGWGIALRTRSGDLNYPNEVNQDIWRFRDAPRWMRIEAVNKLPDLLEALLKQAEETADKIRAKTTQANEVVEAIIRVAEAIGEER